MSHRPVEVSSFLPPDPGQPSAPMWMPPSFTGTGDPRFGPPASPVALEHAPYPRKTFLRRFLSNYTLIAEIITVIVPVVLLIVSAIGPSLDQTPPEESGVSILGAVTQFDWLVTQQLFVTWTIFGHGEYGLDAVGGKSNADSPVDRAVDVYLNNPTNPAFSYDPTLFPTAATGNSYVPLSLVSFDAVHRVSMDKRYYAPFAQYDFAAFAFVIDKATNKSIPITLFAIGDPGPTDFDMRSTQVLAHNNFTYNATGGPATVEVESQIMLGTITHSLHAAALIFLMFLLCWGLCLWSMYIAWTVSRRGLEAKDGVAFLPITLIFSVPTIRSIYMGSVPFGVFLDVVGLFPQMMILFFCAARVLAIAIRQATQIKNSPPEREKV